MHTAEDTADRTAEDTGRDKAEGTDLPVEDRVVEDTAGGTAHPEEDKIVEDTAPPVEDKAEDTAPAEVDRVAAEGIAQLAAEAADTGYPTEEPDSESEPQEQPDSESAEPQEWPDSVPVAERSCHLIAGLGSKHPAENRWKRRQEKHLQPVDQLPFVPLRYSQPDVLPDPSKAHPARSRSASQRRKP